jgi:hypothetical protein
MERATVMLTKSIHAMSSTNRAIPERMRAYCKHPVCGAGMVEGAGGMVEGTGGMAEAAGGMAAGSLCLHE